MLHSTDTGWCAFTAVAEPGRQYRQVTAGHCKSTARQSVVIQYSPASSACALAQPRRQPERKLFSDVI